MRLATVAAIAVFAAVPAFAAATDAQCLSCHEEKNATFHSSVHASNGCSSCHTDVKGFPHPEHVAKVDCGGCHNAAKTSLNTSVHAKASPQPCISCHGDSHAIVPVKDPKSAVYASNLPRTCGACHGDKKFAEQHHLPNVYAQYMDSIHGFALTRDGLLVAATCSSCHGAHDILKPSDPNSRTSASRIPDTCGSCHQGIEKEYMAGVHGQALQHGNAAAPVCTSCHTAHQIGNPKEAAFKVKTNATCGDCHKDRYGTYRDTFHAHVSSLSYEETAHCWDCHKAHDIRPTFDAKSAVAPANLIQTCGKCHPGANAGFVKYSPHADAHNGKAYPMLHLTAIFMNLLLASVLGFFALHTLLWFIRSRFEKPGEEKTI